VTANAGLGHFLSSLEGPGNHILVILGG